MVDELQRLQRICAQAPSTQALLDFAGASEWLDQPARDEIMRQARGAARS